MKALIAVYVLFSLFIAFLLVVGRKPASNDTGELPAMKKSPAVKKITVEADKEVKET